MKIIPSQIIFLLIAVVVLIFLLVILLALKFEKFDDEIADKINYEEDIEELVEKQFVEIEEEPIDISEIPVAILNILFVDDYGRIFYETDGVKRRVVHNDNPVSNISFSPAKDKFGYVENFDIFNEMIPYDKQVVLHIVDIDTKKTKEVYSGSHRASGWEWFSENEVLIPYGCGTECQVLFLIDIVLNKQYQLQYGVGYEWSPNKEMVVAYHYSWKYGITVGDKYGNKLFTLGREWGSEYNDLESKTRAIWSSDSSKIALYIKKEGKDKMELLIFDIEKNFEQIFQSDVDLN